MGPSNDWEEGFVRAWDDAVRGNSALDAALKRRLLEDMAGAIRWSALGIYYDMEKFYDSISVEDLISAMIAFEYPAHLATIDIQVHLGPRRISWQNLVSDPVQVSTSIIAGNRFSNRYARLVVYCRVDAAESTLPSQFLAPSL